MTSTMLATAAALIAFTAPAFAQQEDAGDTAGRAAIYEGLPLITDNPAPPVSEFVESQAAGQLLATDFIGLAVDDPQGTELGKIEDVLFDENGRLSVIVLNVSELVGTNKRIAFNLGDLRRAEDGDNVRLVAALDRAKIEAAPDFKSLADEMQLDDGQSLTEDEAEGATQPAPGN